MRLDDRCQSIELILSDVDGVLTDGGLIFDNQGQELKQFHIRDGMAIHIWQRAGNQFGIITGRSSQMVRLRAAELGVEIVRQGVEEKLTTALQVIGEAGFAPEQVCYVGDDLPDLAVIDAVGLGVAVADAAEEVRRTADYITSVDGGHGAVREVVELILKNQNCWNDMIRKYGA